MPEQTPLETTAGVAATLADVALGDAAVESVQSYAGTAAPYTFNGLVRHYFLRQDPNTADLQVMLVDADRRDAQSHDVARRLRERIVPVAGRLGATVQVVEVPPGPPVLQTLVAEVYGPDPDRRLALARQVREALEGTPGVVDVDWYVESDRRKWRLALDQERAAAAGVTAAELSAVVSMAGAGAPAGRLHDPQAREPVPIVLRRGGEVARRSHRRPRGDGALRTRVPACRQPSRARPARGDTRRARGASRAQARARALPCGQRRGTRPGSDP
jgi:multidrug efflux pump subunit AcrB